MKKKMLIKQKEKILEILRYIVIGLLTTILNILIYYICSTWLNIYYIFSTLIAWILAVIFSFFANRIFVFKREKEKNLILKEFHIFWIFRYLTGLIDVAIMFVGVNLLKRNDTETKIISNIVGTILNYIITKYIVFR
jgi:putative cell wall teichoic acid glycosylation protein gtcA